MANKKDNNQQLSLFHVDKETVAHYEIDRWNIIDYLKQNQRPFAPVPDHIINQIAQISMDEKYPVALFIGVYVTLYFYQNQFNDMPGSLRTKSKTLFGIKREDTLRYILDKLENHGFIVQSFDSINRRRIVFVKYPEFISKIKKIEIEEEVITTKRKMTFEMEDEKNLTQIALGLSKSSRKSREDLTQIALGLSKSSRKSREDLTQIALGLSCNSSHNKEMGTPYNFKQYLNNNNNNTDVVVNFDMNSFLDDYIEWSNKKGDTIKNPVGFKKDFQQNPQKYDLSDYLNHLKKREKQKSKENAKVLKEEQERLILEQEAKEKEKIDLIIKDLQQNKPEEYEELFNLAMSISKTCTKLKDKKLMELDVRMTKLPMLIKSKFNIH